jgi:uncharacterized protein YecT (DUF1311 family)
MRVLAVLFLNAATLWAQTTTPERSPTPRIISMHEMKRNAQADFEKADRILNDVYNKILADLSPKGAGALEEAQRAWLIYRDKSAEAYGTNEEGGSNEGLMYLRCLEAMTIRRTKELKEQFLLDHYPY